MATYNTNSRADLFKSGKVDLEDLNVSSGATSGQVLTVQSDGVSFDFENAQYFDGAYSSLTGAPTNLSSFTNDSGYITEYTVTANDVTAHQADLSITESQISDLQTYLTSVALNDISDVTASGADTGQVLTAQSDGTFAFETPVDNDTTYTNLSEFTNDSGFITDYTVTANDVTAHQADLSITESQISDLQTYLTSVALNDISDVTASGADTGQVLTAQSDGTFAFETPVDNDTTYTNLSEFTNDSGFITDYTVTANDVTAHQADLSITESQISDLQTYLTSETVTSLSIASNILTYTDENGTDTDIDLSLYLDDTNLARLTSGSMASNGTATFTRDDGTTFDVDFSILFDDTNTDTLQSISAVSTDADHYVTFVSSSSGAQTGGSDTALLYNPSTNVLKTGSLNITSADGLSFENGKHWITHNDGKGNFNLRVGHYANGSNQETVTEDGFIFHDEWTQTSGLRQFNVSSASMSVNDGEDADVGAGETPSDYIGDGTHTWYTQISYDESNVILAYQGTEMLRTNANGVDISGKLTLDTALEEVEGGTGQSSYTAGDILYASNANTLSTLAKGEDGQVLKLSSGVPTWAADTDTTYTNLSEFTNDSGYLTSVALNDISDVTASGANTGQVLTAQSDGNFVFEDPIYRGLSVTSNSTSGYTIASSLAGGLVATSANVTMGTGWAVGDVISITNTNTVDITVTLTGDVYFIGNPTAVGSNITLGSRGYMTMLQVASGDWMLSGGGIS